MKALGKRSRRCGKTANELGAQLGSAVRGERIRSVKEPFPYLSKPWCTHPMISHFVPLGIAGARDSRGKAPKRALHVAERESSRSEPIPCALEEARDVTKRARQLSQEPSSHGDRARRGSVLACQLKRAFRVGEKACWMPDQLTSCDAKAPFFASNRHRRSWQETPVVARPFRRHPSR